MLPDEGEMMVKEKEEKGVHWTLWAERRNERGI